MCDAILSTPELPDDQLSGRMLGRAASDLVRKTSLYLERIPSLTVEPTSAMAASTISPGFDETVAEFSSKLRAFIRRRVRDDATADDLTQETLLKVYRSRQALRDGQRLEAWVYRIARTTIIDHFRRERIRDELPESLAADPADDIAPLRDAVIASMRVFLESLPEAYREPVRLAEFGEVPLAEIAKRLGISLTAVKSRVQRGRAMLKKKLQDCCRFEFDRQGKVIGYERRKPCGC